LRDRTQRYISPAVDVDEDGRIVRVVNAALCARPATLNAPALVAREITLQQEASRMDPALVKKALDALEGGDAAGALELLKSLIASAATGEAPDAPADDAPAEPLAEDAEPEPDPEKDQMSAQLRQLREARAADRRELDALRAERQEREDTERRALVGELVTLECELPATAWDDPTEDAPKPAKRLRDEPIADLRARVKALREGKPARTERRPPAHSGETIKLSEAEQAAYNKLPDEASKARFMAYRAARKEG
jgi:phage I-like protein